MDNSEPQFANPQSSSTPAQEQHEESTTPSLPRFDKEHERLQLVRHHYERKGYRVHSGLQFGCEFVLYADDPSKVHSDFCVLVVNEDGSLDWRRLQILVRSMPSLHKTLILAYIRPQEDGSLEVDELAVGSEHAPFRHKKHVLDVSEPGTQRKNQKSK